jgi:phosphoglycolate phosphatase-like HAD superfamily hydrolase
VGVGTGYYTAAQLREAGATHAFDNLGDTAAVIRALFA